MGQKTIERFAHQFRLTLFAHFRVWVGVWVRRKTGGLGHHYFARKVKESADFLSKSALLWLRGKDSNQRPPGYEPDELPAALPRDMENCFVSFDILPRGDSKVKREFFLFSKTGRRSASIRLPDRPARRPLHRRLRPAPRRRVRSQGPGSAGTGSRTAHGRRRRAPAARHGCPARR